MQIAIAEKLKPFCHLPGSECLLPGSTYLVKCFPTLVQIFDLSKQKRFLVKEASLNIEGPVEKFTVIQDLEKGDVKVFGFSQKGYFRYRIIATKDGEGVGLIFEKIPDKTIFVNGNKLFVKEVYFLQKSIKTVELYRPKLTLERLSLGSHKKQDFELILRRKDLKEIFPLWHRLGQMVLDQRIKKTDGCFPFTSSELKLLFLQGFHSMLSPHLEDSFHLGINLDLSSLSSPLLLLTCGFSLIRSLFAEVKKDKIFILPNLPKEFHAGRYLFYHCIDEKGENKGVLDMEWSKKKIRRMIFTPKQSGKYRFVFSSQINSFRLQNQNKRFISNESLYLEEGVNYFFDNFKK